MFSVHIFTCTVYRYNKRFARWFYVIIGKYWPCCMISKATDQAFKHTHMQKILHRTNLYISQSRFGQLFWSNYSMATKDIYIYKMYVAMNTIHVVSSLLVLFWANISVCNRRMSMTWRRLFSDEERHQSVVDFRPDCFGEFCD